MDRFGSANNLITISPSLPNRRGKRPVTIRGPLHVQCGDYGDGIALRHLVDEVIAWPDIEAGPLPVGSADLVSLQVGEDVATGSPSVFITGREFGRVLFSVRQRFILRCLGNSCRFDSAFRVITDYQRLCGSTTTAESLSNSPQNANM